MFASLLNCVVCNQNLVTANHENICNNCHELLRWFRGYFDIDDARSINPSTTFLDLGADSLDYMCWLAEAEVHFGISIPDTIAQQMQTVGNYLRYLSEHGAKWSQTKSIKISKTPGWCGRYSWTVVEETLPDRT